MRDLRLSTNAFIGGVCRKTLPGGLKSPYVRASQGRGSVALLDLTASLVDLCLAENSFVGEIDLKQLPSKLECVFPNNNPLSGSTDFSRLPESMQYLAFQVHKYLE